MKLGEIRILTTNFKDAFEFYKNKLQLTLTFGSEDDSYASFKIGETTIAIFDKSAMSLALGINVPKESNHLDFIINIIVENVDKFHEENKDQLEFINIPKSYKEWGIRAVHLKDPEGNIIEICTMLN